MPVSSAFLLAALLLSGCIGGGSGNRVLRVSGSTTLLPVAEKAAQEFMAGNPGVDVSVNGGGSSAGIKAVGEGMADVGMSSRDVKPDDFAQYPGLKVFAVARDGIAVIVNPSNSVSSLTLEQVRGIYNGSYADWGEVGGSGGQIVLVGRDSTSGTREFFTGAVMRGGGYAPAMLEKNSNGGVQQTVSQTPGAIGYVGLGFAGSGVKAVGISANRTVVYPTVAAVLSREYPVSRDLYLVTNGEPDGLESAFIGFLLGPQGQELVGEEGFVPLR
ncbi:MAG: phosphate ABC transporter substrate-binding protein [Candidatus ainarchaeum sp.]|nr:phosphate ABC transporter substrate-binding protein [Candidatus ainarchaeum sp.]